MSCQRSPAPRPTSSPSRNDPLTLIRTVAHGNVDETRWRTSPSTTSRVAAPSPPATRDQHWGHRATPRALSTPARTRRGRPRRSSARRPAARPTRPSRSSPSVSTASALYVVNPPRKPVPSSNRSGAAVRDVRPADGQPLQQHPERVRAHEVHGEGADRESVRRAEPVARRRIARSSRASRRWPPDAMKNGVRCTGIGAPLGPHRPRGRGRGGVDAPGRARCWSRAPGRIRTCDLEIRRLLLCPAELRAPGARALLKRSGERTGNPGISRALGSTA